MHRAEFPRTDPLDELKLGALSLVVDGSELRYVQWNGVEIVRRVFVTVRDENWDTPASELGSVELDSDGQWCRLDTQATSQSPSVGLDWQVEAEARADGVLSYAARLTPQRPFPYARMGICVLFPPAALVGAHYEAWAGGEHWQGRFQPLIAPQLIRAGEILGLFPAFERLRLDAGDVARLELSLTGDLFEMEDQRNWSDGSFKAYCTPLSIPRPHHALPGHPISQRLRIEVEPKLAAARRPAPAPATAIVAGAPTPNQMPAIGTLVRDPALGDAVVQALREARFEHLRIECRRFDEIPAQFDAAAKLARQVGCGLAPALFLSEEGTQIQGVAELLTALGVPIARVFVFPSDGLCETGRITDLLRRALAGRLAGVPIIGGTDAWFVELNRARPDRELMDGVAWSVTPQVHGEDTLTLFEGLEAQGDQLRTAQSFAPGLDLIVGPITLRPRYNPNAGDAREQALNPPDSSIDPRQADSLAAAWAVGSIAALAQAGATAATYFEAAGTRGIMDMDGRAYPVGHVIKAALRSRGQRVFETRSSDPLKALALATGSQQRPSSILVANLTAERRRIRISPVRQPTRARMLAEAAGGWESCESVHTATGGGELKVELGPYGVAAIATED